MLCPHDPRSPSSFPSPRCGHSIIFPRAVGTERTWQEPTSAPEGQAQCSLLFLFLLTPPATPPLSSQGQGQCLLLECSFKCALLPRLHVFPLSHPPVCPHIPFWKWELVPAQHCPLLLAPPLCAHPGNPSVASILGVPLQIIPPCQGSSGVHVISSGELQQL